MGTSVEERGQPAVSHIRGTDGHWSQPVALGAPGSWIANPGAYGGYGGARAPEAEASRQSWAKPEAIPQWIHGTFQPEGRWRPLGSWVP